MLGGEICNRAATARSADGRPAGAMRSADATVGC